MNETNSRSIFHFTKNIDSLGSILETGFRVSYCNELFFQELIDKKYEQTKSPYFIKIVGDLDGQMPFRFEIPMVSFCDIPLPLSETHRSKYGRYGIGLTHDWAYTNGLNLVHYLSRNSLLTKDFEKIDLLKLNNQPDTFFKYYILYLQSDEILPIYLPSSSPDKIIDNFGNIYSYRYLYLKPFGEIQRGLGMENTINFRNENEWRYVPKNAYILRNPSYSKFGKLWNFGEKYRQNLEQYKPTYQNLEFSPEDIEYIIVPNQSEKILLMKHLTGTRFESSINKITVL